MANSLLALVNLPNYQNYICNASIKISNWRYAQFCVDVTFEIRTVIYRICLFNDTVSKHEHHIYMKTG